MNREVSYCHILSNVEEVSRWFLKQSFHVQTLHYRLKRQHSLFAPSWHKAEPLSNYTAADYGCKILWSACFSGWQTPISIPPCLDIRYRLHNCLIEYPPSCTSAEWQIVQLKKYGQNLKSCFNYLFRYLVKCMQKDVFSSIVDNKSFPSNG